MRVHIDETGSHHVVAHIDLALGGHGEAGADRRDAVAGDREIRLEARTAGAVDDHAAAEDQVGIGAVRSEDRGGAAHCGRGAGEATDEDSTFHGRSEMEGGRCEELLSSNVRGGGSARHLAAGPPPLPSPLSHLLF